MRKILNYCLYIIFLSCFVGCIKDQGNYDYTEFNPIKIDTANSSIKSSYSISFRDVVSIAPKIYYNGELIKNVDQFKDRLSFTWTLCQTFSSGTIFPLDTLSHDIVLDAPILQSSGTWEIKLTVKDLETNIDTYAKFALNISESFPDGWMALYERNGETEVGLIVDERVKSNVVHNRVLYDILKDANGQSLIGKPVTFQYAQSSGVRDRRVIIVSDQDMIGVDKSSFVKTLSFDEFFFASPTTKKVTAFTGIASKDFIINDNRMYALDVSSSPTGRDASKFGLASGNDQIILAPWQPTKYVQSYNGLAYDSVEKKFLKLTSGTTNFTAFTNLPNAVFNPNAVGLDLVVYDWGYGGPTPALAFEYLIMKDATKTYLLSANFASAADAAVPQKKIDMSSYPGITTVNSMTVAVAGQYLLYSNPNNVYLNKFNNNPPTTEEIWAAPNGETITDISVLKSSNLPFQLNANNLFPTVNQYVYFATWNESTENGKIYCYKIDITNGSIDRSTERVYEGFGKIKEMNYKYNLPGT